MSAFKSAISSDSPMQSLCYIALSEKNGTINNAEQQITSCSQRPSVTLCGSASRHPAVKSNTSPSSPSAFFKEIQPSDPPTYKIHTRPAATISFLSPCTCGIRTVLGEWRRGYKKKLHTCAKIASACCWQAAQEPHCGGSCLLPSAKGSRHHGIYLSSNSVTVDFSTKQRFHCPAS